MQKGFETGEPQSGRTAKDSPTNQVLGQLLKLRTGSGRTRALASTRDTVGFSQPPFDRLNLSFSVGDSDESVSANRRLLAQRAGISIDDFVLPSVAHGTGVLVAASAHRGMGSRSNLGRSTADIVVTSEPGLALGYLVADCFVVVLSGLSQNALGVAHIGWRGALAGTVQRAVEAMRDQLGVSVSESENIRIHFLSNPKNVRICQNQKMSESEKCQDSPKLENIRI